MATRLASVPVAETYKVHARLDGVTRIYSSGGLLARRRVVAVDGVDLRLDEGKPEIVTVIGESGSGKSLTALSVMSLLSKQLKRTQGQVIFQGTDLATLTPEEMREISSDSMTKSPTL